MVPRRFGLNRFCMYIPFFDFYSQLKEIEYKCQWLKMMLSSPRMILDLLGTSITLSQVLLVKNL
jgi:hypothetical protein